MPLAGTCPRWVVMTIARLLFVLIGQPPISAHGIAMRMNLFLWRTHRMRHKKPRKRDKTALGRHGHETGPLTVWRFF